MKTLKLVRRALLPAPEIILFLLVFWMSLLFMPDMLNGDGDLGRHITVGNYILETRAIPTRDVFSHTRFDEPFVPHEWLSEVIFAAAHRAAGLNGVAWLTALLLALIYFLLAIGLRALGVSAPLAFLAAFVAYFTGTIHHLPRPHLFSLLCFTLLMIACELYRKTARARWLALLAPLMLVWANLNGAFVLAFFALGAYAVGSWLDRRAREGMYFGAAGAAVLLAALVNPLGIGLIQHVFGFVGNRYLSDVTIDLLAPNFHDTNTWLFAAWILFSIVLFGRARAAVSWASIFLLCAWTAFGLYSARNIPNYAQVAALMTIPLAQSWMREALPRVEKRFQNLDAIAPLASGWVWAITVVALLVYLQMNDARFDIRTAGNQFTEPTFPLDAVTALERNPPRGNGFNEFTWGGYLLYRLYPSQRVFIDGINDFYGEPLTREYLEVINARGEWKKILQKYDVQWVIVPPSRPLAQELAQSEEWREIFRDETAGVWVRKE